MDFLEIARARQSCRSYDTERPVEQEKLDAVLEAAREGKLGRERLERYHLLLSRVKEAWRNRYD